MVAWNSSISIGLLRCTWTLIGLCVFISCTTGPMDIRETHYYAVRRGDNMNYFRLKVNAATRLGDAEYRSGWFPGDAVDSLFGDVTAEGGAKALEARRQIEQQIRDSIVAANAAYQKKALDPKTTPEELDKYLEARRRVLAYPIWEAGNLSDTFEIEYNPVKGVATKHANEKLVFVLSSDPDEVVGRIANFAESDKTVFSVNQLAKIMAQRARNELAAKEVGEEVNRRVDKLIHSQIQNMLTAIGEKPNAQDKQLAIREIDVMLHLLDGVRR